MPDSLFVYGSLRSEFDNAHARRLRGEADWLGPATVRGSIFFIGELQRYPGYRRDPDGIVRGELWRLRNAPQTLAALDDYEGPEYSRVEIDLETPRTSAWIYLYTGAVLADKRIVSGDFLTP